MKGNRGKFGIRTHGADRDKLLNTREPGLLHKLNAHDSVVVKESPRAASVRFDAANYCCEMEDDIRADALDQSCYLRPFAEVDLGRAGGFYQRAAAVAQGLHNEASKK